ncbi:MAG: hypothetical protein R3F65_09425 [bacterium]|nr:hypothetical protein [Myxococcales bacterium]
MARWGLLSGVCAGWLSIATGCGGGPETVAPTKVIVFECPQDKLMDDDVARRFPTASLPSVWAVLEDKEQAECWETALRIAGYAASDDAFARLRGFIEHRAQDFALSGDQVVLQSAVTAIAQVVRSASEPTTAQQALEFLVEGINPATWAKRSTKWPIDAVMRRELIRILSRSSVKALAQTDRPEAHQSLRALAVDAVDRRSLAFKFTGAEGEADRVEELINLHVLPPGRVAFAMDATLIQIRGERYDDLRKRVEEVRDRAVETFELEQQWLVAARGNERFQQAVRAADTIADSRLSGFHGQLDSLRHLVDAADDYEAIERVSRVIFPRGPLEIVALPYSDQVAHVLGAMQLLRTDNMADLERLRLVPHVAVVVEAHEALQRALLSGQRGQGFERVLESRASLQTLLRVLVATVVARYPGKTDPDRRQRALLLGPVMDQNGLVDNFLLRNEAIRDVDPASGQELAPPEEGGEAVQASR